MKGLLALGLRDPLLVKEFRTRMRARTVLIVELLYVLGLCGIVLVELLFAGRSESTPGWQVGADLFGKIIYLQAYLMFFVGPLVAAAAISGEKEEKTFDSLCVTPVIPRRIVTAKLLAVLGCFFALTLASLPLACTSFILGGVAPADLLRAYTLTFLSTAAAVAVGLYWSTRFDRSIASIPAAAVCAVLALILPPALREFGLTAVTTISPPVFLKMLEEEGSVSVFGSGCSFWIPAAILLALIFLYFLAAACTRMAFARERRYVWQRFLGFALFLGIGFFVAGESLSPNAETGASVGSLDDVRSRLSGTFALAFCALTALAVWVGANGPVIRSETGPRARKSAAGRFLGRLFTHPVSFVGLLLAGGAAILLFGVSRLAVPGLNGWRLWALYAGAIGGAVMTWALLSRLLSNRRTTRGRFIGMAAAYGIAAVICLVPFILFHALQAEAPAGPPNWVQFLSLASPFVQFELFAEPRYTGRCLGAVAAAFGKDALPLATPALYLFLAALLSLPWSRLLFRLTVQDEPGSAAP